MVLRWDLSHPHETTMIAKTDSSVYIIHELSESSLLIGNKDGTIYTIETAKKDILAKNELGETLFDWYIDTENGLIYAALANGYISILKTSDLSVLSKQKIAQGHLRVARKLVSEPTLILGSSDRCIYKYDLITHTATLLRSNAHTDSVFSLHPISHELLLSGGKDAHLKLWRIEQDQLIEETSIPAHLFTINQIIEGPEGTHVITASRDKTIKFWSPQSILLEKVIDKSKFPDGPTHSVNRIMLLDFKHLISVGDDKAVRIWNISF